MKDGMSFGLGGIWENWRNMSGERERTFCIITVPANDLVGPIHDRIPAIIPMEKHALAGQRAGPAGFVEALSRAKQMKMPGTAL
jgi:hypothetical protein